MKCEMCGNECTNLEDGICCFERLRHHLLFETPKIICENCKGAEAQLNEKLQRFD